MINTYTNETYKGKPDIVFGSFLFVNCLFIACQDVKSSGGALFSDSDKGYISIDGCAFLDCSAPSNNGGAIFCMNSNDVIICKSAFSKCSAEQGLSMFIYSQSLNLVMNTTDISNCPGSDQDTGLDSISLKGGAQAIRYLNSSSNELSSQFSTISTEESTIFIFEYSFIIGNIGSGIMFFSQTRETDIIANLNIIMNSFGDQGLISFNQGYTIIKNSLLLKNRGNTIISIMNIKPTLEDCSLFENSADLSSLQLLNCITSGKYTTLNLPRFDIYKAPNSNHPTYILELSNQQIPTSQKYSIYLYIVILIAFACIFAIFKAFHRNNTDMPLETYVKK